MKRSEEKQRRTACVLIPAALLILAAVLLCIRTMRYEKEIRAYLARSEYACPVPGLEDGFVPQGLAWHPDTDTVLISGYYGMGRKSPVFLVDRSSGDAKQIFLETEDGTPFTGHGGGISILDETVYIAGSTEGCMYRIPLNALLEAEDGGIVRGLKKTSLMTPEDRFTVSFTAQDGDRLYAGEFRSPLFFRTHASHAVRTSGGTQRAYLAGFRAGEDGSLTPEAVYSIPDRIQGACFSDGYLFLSQSQTLFSSRILAWRLEDLSPAGTRKVLGSEVPLYVLTEASAGKATRVAPMSEEIEVRSGRLMILYESASNRYRIGKKYGLDRVLETPLSRFMPQDAASRK